MKESFYVFEKQHEKPEKGLKIGLDIYLSVSASVEIDITEEELNEMSADQRFDLIKSLIDFSDLEVVPNDLRDLEITGAWEVDKATGMEVTN